MKLTREEKEAVDAQVLACIRTKAAVTAGAIEAFISYPRWAVTHELQMRIVDQSLQRLKRQRKIWYHRYPGGAPMHERGAGCWVEQGSKPT